MKGIFRRARPAPGPRPKGAPDAPPFAGYSENRSPAPYVDCLSDADLAELDTLLRWNCFTVDAHGRRFGDQARPDKRNEPQAIPDRRVVMMDRRFGLGTATVLELGCFEGIHTIALAQRAARVTAIDARIENVVKTIVRCALFGLHPTVFACNIEEPRVPEDWLRADLVHHVGVLYHLQDPVRHLQGLGRHAGRGLMLDTHFTLDVDAREEYEVEGRAFRYRTKSEKGHGDVFSGVYAQSKWLRLPDITDLLEAAGFASIEVVEHRDERNGPRVLLFAAKESGPGH